MKLVRVRKKGRRDEYRIYEGGDSEWEGYLHARVEKDFDWTGKKKGWWLMPLNRLDRIWCPTLDYALRYCEQQVTDDRILAKMEAVL